MNPSPLTPEQQQQMQALIGTPASVYNPTKKYIFLEDTKVYRIPSNYGEAQTLQVVLPKEFKKDEIVDGIARKINGNTYIQIGVYGVLYASPVANIKPILKELNPQIAVDPSVIFKEKPTTTENPTFFNKKNITTGVFVLIGIGVTLALLKWKKII